METIRGLLILFFCLVTFSIERANADSCAQCSSHAPQIECQTRTLLAPLKQTNRCDIQTLLVDPHQKSVLENIGLPYKGHDPFEIIGRSALTCMYGALKGVAGSIRDLVMLVPDVLDMSYEGAKKAISAARSFDYEGWYRSLHPQHIIDRAASDIEYGAESVRKAFTSASRSVYNAYETGGVSGSIAAVAHAAAKTSPHRVIADFLAKVAKSVAEALGNEWQGFTCQSPETMVQNVCNVIGYIGTDLLTGKVALSALRRTPKFLEALKRLKAVLETKPGFSKIVMKGLKKTEDAKCATLGHWMEDSKIVLQMQNAKVAISEDHKVFARAIDPATKRESCFQVAGDLAKQVEARVRSSEARAGRLAKSADESDFFSPSSSGHARSMKDFVGDVNTRAGLAMTPSKADKIAKALEQSPEAAEQYGQMMKALSEVRQSAASDKAAERTLRASENLVAALNESLLKSGSHASVELASSAIEEARQTGDGSAVRIVMQAMREADVSAPKAKTVREMADAWKKSLKKSDRGLTDEELNRARQCLFGSIH